MGRAVLVVKVLSPCLAEQPLTAFRRQLLLQFARLGYGEWAAVPSHEPVNTWLSPPKESHSVCTFAFRPYTL